VYHADAKTRSSTRNAIGDRSRIIPRINRVIRSIRIADTCDPRTEAEDRPLILGSIGKSRRNHVAARIP